MFSIFDQNQIAKNIYFLKEVNRFHNESMKNFL